MLGNNRVVDVIYEEESNKITGIIASKPSRTRSSQQLSAGLLRTLYSAFNSTMV